MNTEKEQFYNDVHMLYTKLSSNVEEVIKKRIEEKGYCNSAWLLNMGFSAIFSTMLDFLDSVIESTQEEDDVKKIADHVKNAFITCSDLHKYFERKTVVASPNYTDKIQ